MINDYWDNIAKIQEKEIIRNITKIEKCNYLNKT